MTATLTVTPEDALYDTPRRIAGAGLAPGAEVALHAWSTQPDGRRWESRAVFRADAEGGFDLTRDAPVAGDYEGVSAMGPVWSQAPAGTPAGTPLDPVAPVVTQLRATSGGQVAEARLVQTLLAPGVTRQTVRTDGLVGTLFTPAGPSPHPAVMQLNGSNGGVNEPIAALLAAHGFATLTLGYFNIEGRPRYISNTPLEYFAEGLDWLRRTVRPAGDFVAVLGASRGGELALLLGATFPERISAVVGYVPGAYVHSGQSAADPAVGRDGPCWTLGGKPLPHLWQDNRTASWKPYDEMPPPGRHAAGVMTALADPEATARARIPVERIGGPVLLIAGTDDGSWPADLYAQTVADTLVRAGHSHEVTNLRYEGAGHAIRYPVQPTTQVTYRHPVSGRLNTTGGTAKLNAEASAAAWPEVIAFLRRAAGRY